jgi:hypothetical protein
MLVSTSASAGIINMGARAYIPQLGRYEQTDPQPGGSANPYTYTFDDPINQADPGGEWTYNYETHKPASAKAQNTTSDQEPSYLHQQIYRPRNSPPVHQ